MRSRTGNTLLEVMLAMALVGIVVIAVSNLVMAVNRLDASSAHKEQAIGYAREGLEIAALTANGLFLKPNDCTGLPPGYTKCWSDCPTGLDCDGSYGINLNSRTLANNPDDPDGTGFMTSRTITITDDPSTPNIKRVISDVAWTERNQPTRHVKLETVLTAWNAI